MIAVARLAIAIGLAGLLPFLFGVYAVVALQGGSIPWAEYFYLYSAGVLAFMAGVYWPIAMQLENRCFPLSPMVTLLISQAFFLTAGFSLLLPLTAQMLVYPVAYGALYVVDTRWLRLYWPAWYRKLRMVLTLVACACQLGVAGYLLILAD